MQAIRWQAPNLSPAPVAAPAVAPTRPPPSVEEIAAIELGAREEGFARGKKEGFAQGQTEVNRLIAQLGAVLHGFTRPLEHLDDDIVHALGELSVRVAGALLGQAYQADPRLLEVLVRATLSEAGIEAREAVVHLHPADLMLLSTQIGAQDTAPIFDAKLIADPSLARFDVRVHTPQMRIDAALDARLRQAAQALVEGSPS